MQHLQQVGFIQTPIKSIEKEAFRFNKSVEYRFYVTFDHVNLTPEIFSNGTFDGRKYAFFIKFTKTNMAYLSESVFGSMLSQFNNQSRISFDWVGDEKSLIDCSDCRNHWLIKQQRDKQVYFPFCQQDQEQQLFSDEIQEELNKKCK